MTSFTQHHPLHSLLSTPVLNTNDGKLVLCPLVGLIQCTMPSQIVSSSPIQTPITIAQGLRLLYIHHHFHLFYYCHNNTTHTNTTTTTSSLSDFHFLPTYQRTPSGAFSLSNNTQAFLLTRFSLQQDSQSIAC